ncbi:hypothetical protein QM565_10230 [Geitlerinema splendidum]|nr:hypothetical protein [Geitlerinema splendidum]
MSNTQLTEEPDAPKGARPVLEARQGGDSLSLASGFPGGKTFMKDHLERLKQLGVEAIED